MTAERARETPGRAAVARRKAGRAPGEPRNVAYLYILPGLAAYLIFTFFPLLQTVRLSFYDWDGLTPKKWIGLDNYRELWNTPEIQAAFQHSVELILFYAVFSIVLGLAPDCAADALPSPRLPLLPHGAVHAADHRHGRRRAGIRVDLRTRPARSTSSCATSASAPWPRRGSETSHGRCRPSA